MSSTIAAQILATGIRWVGLAALATLIGSLVVRHVVLPSPMRGSPSARRLARLARVSTTVLLATTLGELGLRAQVMAEEALGPAIAAFPIVLMRTHFGAVWIARLALLLAMLAAMATAPSRAGPAALASSAMIALTTAMTGHAGDWGDLTASVAIDWTHMLAVSAWTGGLIALSLAVLRDGDAWPAGTLGRFMHRFSRLAGICLPVAVASGAYNAWLQLATPSALWMTPYGLTLAVKVLLVLVVIWWGALTRYTILPALEPDHPAGLGERCFLRLTRALRGRSKTSSETPSSRLRGFVTREALVAALVLASTAVLIESTPARHAGHPEHHAGAEPAGGQDREVPRPDR